MISLTTRELYDGRSLDVIIRIHIRSRQEEEEIS